VSRPPAFIVRRTQKAGSRDESHKFAVLHEKGLAWVENPHHAKKFPSRYACKRFIQQQTIRDAAVHQLHAAEA